MLYMYSNPQNADEAKCRFRLLEHNGDRVKIQAVINQFGPVTDRIKPVEVVAASEIMASEDSDLY